MTNQSGLQPPDRLVPSGSLIHLVRWLDEEGLDTTAIKDFLQEDFSTITEKNSRMEVEKINGAYEMAMQLPISPGFWLRLGQSYSVHNFHLELGNWILTAKNYAEIMSTLQWLYGNVSPRHEKEGSLGAIGESEKDGQVWLHFPLVPDNQPRHIFQPQAELLASSIIRGFTSLLGQKLPQIRFFFDYPAPEYAECYREILGPCITFNAPQNEVHIPRIYFYQDFPTSDPIMHQYYETVLADFFNTGHKETQVVEKLESLLLDSDRGFPSMLQVCDALKIGERTLRRSLQRSGTSYRELLRDTKMKHARHYLRHTNLSIEEIAHRLDYSDYANFRRAFQAKFAETPSSFRKRTS